MDDGFKQFPAWKNALSQLIGRGLTYGGAVAKEEIAKLCDLQPPRTIEQKEAYDLKLLACVSDIKKALLLNHQMLLTSNNDGTYRVINPTDQTCHVVTHGGRAIAKELQRMATGVQYVNLSLVDELGKRKNADTQAKLSMLAGMHNSLNKEMRQISNV